MKPLLYGCLASLVFVVAACKSSGSDGGGGSGGGTTSSSTSGSSGGNSTCDGVCSALMSQHCFYGGGDADCRMSCNGWETQYVAKGADYCQKAWSDYKACITSSTLTCAMDSDAHWGVIQCREHWDHFNSYCINMNATPTTACMSNSAFDTFCMGDAAHPHGQSCFGDKPAGCVVGGTESNSNLYCCP